MRANTGEQLREINEALKQDQRNYLHEVMQGQARIAELEAELAAIKEIPEQIEIAGYKASDGSLMSAESGALFAAKYMDRYEPLITLADHNAIVSSIKATLAELNGGTMKYTNNEELIEALWREAGDRDTNSAYLMRRAADMLGKFAGEVETNVALRLQLHEAKEQASVPDGFVLVPIEPTKAMIDAALRSDKGLIDPRSIIVEDYRQMLAAAPSSPAAQGWIPVSEGLPESATDVLVYGINHGSRSYTVAGLFSGSWASQETEETTRFEPTHWMPLPSAPEVNHE